MLRGCHWTLMTCPNRNRHLKRRSPSTIRTTKCMLLSARTGIPGLRTSDSQRSSSSDRPFMATSLLPPEFGEFLESLNSNKVEYLLLGGYSVIYYGYLRSTGDIDFWIKVSSKNAARVSKALVEYGFAPVNVAPRRFLRKKKVFRTGNPPFRIDILTDVSGLDFDACYARRTVAEIDGIPVNVISLKDLKRNKRASGRLKDLDDLENLP